MSNNAIYEGLPYRIVEVIGHEVELELVDAGPGETIWVNVIARTLIIDPTDDEWAAVRRPA